jgi:hypothetical protein
VSFITIIATVSCPVWIDDGECRCNEELPVELLVTEGEPMTRDFPGTDDAFELKTEPTWCGKGRHPIDPTAMETLRIRINDGEFEWEPV